MADLEKIQSICQAELPDALRDLYMGKTILPAEWRVDAPSGEWVYLDFIAPLFADPVNHEALSVETMEKVRTEQLGVAFSDHSKSHFVGGDALGNLFFFNADDNAFDFYDHESDVLFRLAGHQ